MIMRKTYVILTFRKTQSNTFEYQIHKLYKPPIVIRRNHQNFLRIYVFCYICGCYFHLSLFSVSSNINKHKTIYLSIYSQQLYVIYDIYFLDHLFLVVFIIIFGEKVEEWAKWFHVVWKLCCKEY